MVGNVLEGLLDRDRALRIKGKALKALEDSDLSEALEEAGILEGQETMGAALKAVMAERLADCAIRAMREAKKRRMRLGAAAIVIAAQQQ